MASGQGSDPVEQMYEACLMDLLPHSHDCLRAFHFDRCTDWCMLFGLYQGIMVVIEKSLQTSYKEEFKKAVREHRPIACMEDIYNRLYRDYPQHPHSGYWKWFLANRAQLIPRSNADSAVPAAGDRIRIRNLQATPALNGAVGKITGAVDGSSGRYPVRVSNPPTAVKQFPDGVRVKAANMEVLPPGGAAAVLIIGTLARPAYAFGTPSSEGWRKCAVPHMLGLPLMYLQLAGTWVPQERNEQVATYLLIDPVTGYAPVQYEGLGPVLVARSDGKDFGVEELYALHDYNCTLMDRWPDFTPQTRQQALTCVAYGRHVQANQRNPYRKEEDEEEE